LGQNRFRQNGPRSGKLETLIESNQIWTKRKRRKREDLWGMGSVQLFGPAQDWIAAQRVGKPRKTNNQIDNLDETAKIETEGGDSKSGNLDPRLGGSSREWGNAGD